MPLDAVVLHAVTLELQKLTGGRIDKVQMPEKDALLLSVRGQGEKSQAAHIRQCGYFPHTFYRRCL